MSKIANEGGLNLVWHRMLYSCTHVATVGVKRVIFMILIYTSSDMNIDVLLAGVSTQ